jgi:hypothetical protein
LRRRSEDDHEDLVRAARGDIPARYAHPLWISIAPDGAEAVVVLGLNNEPYVEVEEVQCRWDRGRWHAMSSANGLGIGWTLRRFAEDGPSLGLLQLSGEAPAEAETAVIRWAGHDHEVPVVGGHFFFGVWDVPDDFDETAGYPHVVRYVRRDGTPEAVPPAPDAPRLWESMRHHRWRLLSEIRAMR